MFVFMSVWEAWFYLFIGKLCLTLYKINSRWIANLNVKDKGNNPLEKYKKEYIHDFGATKISLKWHESTNHKRKDW